MNKYQFDIIIVGAGVVGLTMACLLSDRANRILLIDRNAEKQETAASHSRVSALNLASITAFKEIDVWQEVDKSRLCPFTHMQVWDVENQDSINFSCDELGWESLGVIIENGALMKAIRKKAARTALQTEYNCRIDNILNLENGVDLQCSDGRKFQSSLLIASDGANSICRNLAAIAIAKTEYQQQAIVTMIETNKPHQNCARQWFLPSGPLALLPLSAPHRCSIVWSIDDDLVDQHMEMSEAAFNSAITAATQSVLGECKLTAPRLQFPLRAQHARDYHRGRVALLGDAAHVIHPLAGLGLNLGIADAIVLSQLIADIKMEELNLPEIKVLLGRYQRRRHGENEAILNAMTAFKSGFQCHNRLVSGLRRVAISLVDTCPVIKHPLMRLVVGGNHIQMSISPA